MTISEHLRATRKNVCPTLIEYHTTDPRVVDAVRMLDMAADEIDRLERDNAKLRKTPQTGEIHELLRDKDRLDWLLRRERMMLCEIETGLWGIGEYQGNVNDREFVEVVPEEHETGREAIDAAIKEGKP